MNGATPRARSEAKPAAIPRAVPRPESSTSARCSPKSARRPHRGRRIVLPWRYFKVNKAGADSLTIGEERGADRPGEVRLGDGAQRRPEAMRRAVRLLELHHPRWTVGRAVGPATSDGAVHQHPWRTTRPARSATPRACPDELSTAMTSGRWATDDLPDLTDRTAVVTGATSGLGLATTAALVYAWATVVLAVPDLDRGQAVEEALATTARVRELDLADLESVRHFAAQLLSEGEPIDILVNNAGVMAVPEGRTADGFKLDLGAEPSRPLRPHQPAASARHRPGRDGLLPPRTGSRGSPRRPQLGAAPLPQVGGPLPSRSFANLLFTLELDRRLRGRWIQRSGRRSPSRLREHAPPGPEREPRA